MPNFSTKELQNHHKIAIIVAKFNNKITEKLLARALTTLEQQGFSEQQITVVHVPGAVEIGFIANRLAKQQQYSAIICFGAIINGETAHFEHVSQLCVDACNQVMLTHDIPVIFGVLTTYSQQQATDRVNGKTLDMGKESVETAIEMISLSEQLS